jgi:hypothetical protein
MLIILVNGYLGVITSLFMEKPQEKGIQTMLKTSYKRRFFARNN